MQRKHYLIALLLLSLVSLGQGPHRTVSHPGQPANQAERERQFLARRQNFTTGRELLLTKRVPFDPDDLLRDDWPQKLKPALDAMPEMQQTRYEKAPLKGAYLADTLYLPEKVQLSGHTVLLANYVVFEGKNPEIKGNFDLHFFPRKPVAVLDTTLAEVLRQNARFLQVKLNGKTALPSFSLIAGKVHSGTHNIVFDVSGLPPQSERKLAPPPGSALPQGAKLQSTSWDPVASAVAAQSTIDCNVGCKNNGEAGGTGTPGFSPPQAATGNPNGGSPGADGSCATGQSPNGFFGTFGGPGVQGQNAGDGGTGGPGFNAGNINAYIFDGDANQYTFQAIGGPGGQGGIGGTGGTGGNGGNGANGGNGVTCGCTAGIGGAGGKGGDAGPGGHGGNGGQGGNGGNAGTITVSLPYDSPGVNTFYSGGGPGRGGDPGPGGLPGNPGLGGDPGIGAKDCNGNQASRGSFLGGGNSAGSLPPGDPGPWGQNFGANGSQNVTFRDPPQPPPPNDCDPNSEDQCLGSPIIIDTEAEGFHLTSPVGGVTFDMKGNGHPVQIAWTDARYQNAFLVLPGVDGLVHNGGQLFGNFTSQPPSAHPNGFIALAQYDKPENGGNGDGIIDDRDAVFSRLRLWIDANHDGISQPNELHQLSELGVYSLALKYIDSPRTDQFGNQFRYKAQVDPGSQKDARDQTASGDPGRWTYDVFLVMK